MLYIVPNKYTEEEVKNIAKNIGETITKQGGKTLKSSDYGKLKLAYPIKGCQRGYYEYVEFEMEPKNVANLDKAMRLNLDIARHLVVSYEEGSREAHVSDNKKKVIVKKDTVTLTEEVTKPKADNKDKEKIQLEDLDKKLNEIIDSNII